MLRSCPRYLPNSKHRRFHCFSSFVVFRTFGNRVFCASCLHRRQIQTTALRKVAGRYLFRPNTSEFWPVELLSYLILTSCLSAWLHWPKSMMDIRVQGLFQICLLRSERRRDWENARLNLILDTLQLWEFGRTYTLVMILNTGWILLNLKQQHTWVV